MSIAARRSGCGAALFDPTKLIALSASGFAQSGTTYKLHCTSVGYNPPEPLGDREGHAVAATQFSCRVDGGPWDKGVLTGSTIWEYDKTNAVALAGAGVTRKPGATSTYRNTEAKLALTMTDGKPTGFTGSGRGVYTMTTGSAAALAGKTYTFTFATSGPGQFVVDVKVD